MSGQRPAQSLCFFMVRRAVHLANTTNWTFSRKILYRQTDYLKHSLMCTLVKFAPYVDSVCDLDLSLCDQDLRLCDLDLSLCDLDLIL